MKNQKVVIIGSVLALGALALFLMNKKKLESKIGGIMDTGVPSEASSGNISVTLPGEPAETEVASIPAGAMTVKMIIKDGGKGTSNIMLEGNQPISRGQPIQVNTPELKGTYTVWYVYHGKAGTQPVTNLHLTNAPYNSDKAAITTTGYAVKA